MKCWNCGREIGTTERVEFRARCPGCDEPAHVCLNCGHYAPELYNQCRETMAERVVDKQAQNFCEFFLPHGGSAGRASSDSGAAARSRLEALFAKKNR